ncbi:MAG: hypothetical protein H7X91_05965 [Burkholderiales bacterium]|nr:hypothetical protein [Burkholderiales bacterium]
MRKDIKVLSEESQKELGGANLMFVVAFDRDGKQTVFRSTNVTAAEVKFPEAIKEVLAVDAMSVVSVKRNPKCCYWISGGRQYSFCWG